MDNDGHSATAPKDTTTYCDQHTGTFVSTKGDFVEHEVTRLDNNFLNQTTDFVTILHA